MDVVKAPKAKMFSDVEIEIIREFMFAHKDELEKVQGQRGGIASCGKS